MSHTPTDDPDPRREPPSTSESAPGTDASALDSPARAVRPRIERALGRAGRSIRRAFGRVGRWFRSDAGAEDGTSLADSAVPPPECPPVAGLTPRSFPLTYPTRSYRTVDNGIDLDSHCDEETFTLVDPDEPQAHIESDTWVPVER